MGTTNDETFRLLSTEVLMIVTVSYPVSLRNLNSILLRLSDSDVNYWALQNPCHVGPLAAAVVAALDLCPFSLYAIEKLAVATNFRDAFLRARPDFLENLLRDAISTKGKFKKYSRVCIAFIQNPLPKEFPIPITLTAFLGELIESLAQKSTPDDIRSILRNIYLSTRNNGYLTGVSHPTRIARLCELLKNHLAGEDMRLTLACLASIKMNIAASLGPNHNATSALSEQSRCVAVELHRLTRGFFSLFESKAAKLLPLAGNDAIASVKAAGTTDIESICEQLEHWSMIIMAVDGEKKAEFLNSKNAEIFLKNIIQKASGTDLPLEIAFMTFQLLEQISSNAATEFAGVLLTRLVREKHPSGVQWPAGFVEISMRHHPESIAQILLSFYTATTTLHPALILQSHTLVEQVIRDIPATLPVLQKLINVLHLQNLEAFLEHKFVVNEYELSGNNPRCCSRNTMQRLRGFVHALCQIVLLAHFHIEDKQALSTDILARLLARHAETSTKQECSHVFPKKVGMVNKSSFSIAEQISTPSSQRLDWRSQLSNELLRQASRNNEVLVESVANICRDLEIRCEQVELPLRAEEERSRKLEASVISWKSKAEELSLVLRDRTDNLQAAADALEKLEARHLDDIHEQQSRCLLMEAKLQQAEEQNGNEQIANQRLNAENSDLADQIETLRISLEACQSEKQIQTDKMCGLEKENRARLEQLDQLIKERQCLKEELESIQQQQLERFAQYQLELSTVQNSMETKITEMNEKYREDIESLQLQFDNVNTESGLNIQRLNKEVKSLKSKTVKLTAERDDALKEYSEALGLARKICRATGKGKAGVTVPRVSESSQISESQTQAPIDSESDNTQQQLPTGGSRNDTGVRGSRKSVRIDKRFSAQSQAAHSYHPESEATAFDEESIYKKPRTQEKLRFPSRKSTSSNLTGRGKGLLTGENKENATLERARKQSEGERFDLEATMDTEL